MGKWGSAADRMAVLTASARSVPALTCGATCETDTKPSCTCPPIMSVMSGPVPRQGTCFMRMPVSLTTRPAARTIDPARAAATNMRTLQGSMRRVKVGVPGGAPSLSRRYRVQPKALTTAGTVSTAV